MAPRSLLADAEARKNLAQNVVAGHLTGDFTEGLLSLAELFRRELTRAARAQHIVGSIDGSGGTLESVQVPVSFT